MAEAIDVLVEACRFMESNVDDAPTDVKSRHGGSKIIERINLIALAVGKFADLVADWVLVWQVYRVLEAVSGCTDACEFSGNWVCQDGVGLSKNLPQSGAVSLMTKRPGMGDGYCLSSNISVLPQACEYGTDCSDCGPRPPLNQGTSDFPMTIKLIAWSIAIAGTSIELIAASLKFRLVCTTSSGIVYIARSLQLNRSLAMPRFLLDDLPATCLSIYILLAFPHHASAASLTLLLLSISYSIFAVMYHTCRSLSGEDTSLYAELKEAGLTLQEMRGVGMSAAEVKGLGFSAVELRRAGYLLAEKRNLGFSASELKAAGYTLSEMKSAGIGLSAEELLEAGFSVVDMRQYGISAAELNSHGIAMPTLKEAGYPLNEMQEAGYLAREARKAGYSNEEIEQAGYKSYFFTA
jgi:ribosomal protein L13E